MNKIIGDCNKYYNGNKGDSEYLENVNVDFSPTVEFICNSFMSFISHISMWQGCQANLMGKRIASSTNDAGTTDVHMNEFGSLLHTIYKI